MRNHAAAAVLTVLLALSGAAVLAVPAQAAPAEATPVLAASGPAAPAQAAPAQTAARAGCTARYRCPAVLTNLGPWTAATAPRRLYLGNGGAPFLTGLHWRIYRHARGRASGYLHAISAHCQPPIYRCRYYAIAVTVTTRRARWNAAHRRCYYTRMHWWWRTWRDLVAQHHWLSMRGFWEPAGTASGKRLPVAIS